MSIRHISDFKSDNFEITLKKCLKKGEFMRPLLSPRIPGTEAHHKAQSFILNTMRNLGYYSFEDRFKDKTPFSEVEFNNLMFTDDPNANSYVVLAAHYDSKMMPEKFIGATDSAASCAILLTLAEMIQTMKSSQTLKRLPTIMFIFFDGEEAFVNWSQSDSLYGSRHLAKLFASNSSVLFKNHTNSLTSKLASDSIEVFILLDLLGSPDPKIYSFFDKSHQWYVKLSLAEDVILDSDKKNSKYFVGKANFDGHIEDDHVPFLPLNIPIVHIIPVPFPSVWHTAADNEDALNDDVIQRWVSILFQFLISY